VPNPEMRAPLAKFVKDSPEPGSSGGNGMERGAVVGSILLNS
jgi:hypothetical protein